jgi:hypothetical protein
MVVYKKEVYVFGKVQRITNFIETNKYDHLFPLRITKNRPDGIIKEMLSMMKNETNINIVKNFIQPYLIN